MQKFFHKKVVTPFLAVVLAVVCMAGGAFLGYSRGAAPSTGAAPGAAAGAGTATATGAAGTALTPEQLYRDAVADAVMAEEDEIYPLVTLTREGGMASFREGKVLLLTVNDSPEQYTAGETLTLPGEVWTFTDREIAAWYPEHKEGVEDWPLRLMQLVGVPPDAGYTHVTAMWVAPEDVTRPAYVTDVTKSGMELALAKDTPEEYRQWFRENILWSYFDSAYPWTRMGYTYDWAPDSGEYGLTEFLVRPGAEAEIEYTDSIDLFIKRLEDMQKH